VLGLFSEDPVEREHNIDNKSQRALACLKSFERISKTKHKNSSKAANPEVQRVIKENFQKSERKVGAQTAARREEADTQMIQTKRMRRKNVKSTIASAEIASWAVDNDDNMKI
jgi:hypothetical protein